jgi:hypothetical protein
MGNQIKQAFNGVRCYMRGVKVNVTLEMHPFPGICF